MRLTAHPIKPSPFRLFRLFVRPNVILSVSEGSPTDSNQSMLLLQIGSEEIFRYTQDDSFHQLPPMYAGIIFNTRNEGMG